MAKRFTFKLQKVLDYRQQLEDKALIEMGRAQAAYDQESQRLADLEEKLRLHIAKGYGQKGISEGDIWLWRQYKDALDMDVAAARQEVHRLALLLQQCRQQVAEKAKDRKLLEKLKEKQAQQYYEEQQQAEQKENDEMAALRFKNEIK
ncbi:MAG: flagellar export protein FliJ [Desulfovibrio sp.]